MKINVVDLESTCWDGPSDIPSEIIQIGISTYNTRTDEITPAYSVFVKPEISTELSDYCKELTGLTDKQVFSGLSFPAAMERLKEEFKIHNRMMASWGSYDFIMLRDAVEKHGMTGRVLTRNHFNLKGLHLLMDSKKVGLTAALEELGLGFEGRWHDGGDDAFNTARILRHHVRNIRAVSGIKSVLVKEGWSN